MPSGIPLRYRLGQLAIEATESDTVTGSVIPVEEKVPACRRTEEEKNHHEGHEEEASFITLSFVPFVVLFLRSFPLLSSRRRPGCEAGPLGFCGNFRRSRFARQKVADPFCPTAQGVFTRCTSSRTIPTCTEPFRRHLKTPGRGRTSGGFDFKASVPPDGGGRPEALVGVPPDGGGRPEAMVSIASPVPHTGTWTYGRASLKGCPGPRQREPRECFSGEALPVARLEPEGRGRPRSSSTPGCRNHGRA